ncbi:Ail/Lom family protein, partial [Erwinia endophytica]|uniref:Ail/Lom family outer membrane beta-barrel protein n=1 Tax=Erwinia endophytica TaxID=1563158 RepID=UPI001265F613
LSFILRYIYCLVFLGAAPGNLYYNGKKTSFMYGAGVQINPTENWAVDVGYEGSSFDDNEKRRSLNGFNIGVGYRF